MVKKLSTLVIMMMVFAGMSYAQGVLYHDGEGGSHTVSNNSSASANGTAKITVFNSLTAGAIDGSGAVLDFGSVAPGITSTIAPTDSKAAGFKFSGENGAGVNITYPTSITMTSGSGYNAASLTVQNVNSVYNTTQTQTGSGNDNGAISTNLASQNGMLYMWIGGKVQVPSNQASGDYTGTFTVTVSYTGT